MRKIEFVYYYFSNSPLFLLTRAAVILMLSIHATYEHIVWDVVRQQLWTMPKLRLTWKNRGQDCDCSNLWSRFLFNEINSLKWITPVCWKGALGIVGLANRATIDNGQAARQSAWPSWCHIHELMNYSKPHKWRR